MKNKMMVSLSRVWWVLVICVVAASPAFAQPGATTLRSPSGVATSTTIVFTFDSVPEATWYQFWLGTATPSALVQSQWFTAAQLGCAGGGACTISLTPPIGPGGHVWYVQTWNAAGAGPWSAGMAFTFSHEQYWGRTVPNNQRFTLVMNNEAVLDNETGLVWQRAPSATATSWAGMLNTCFVATTGSRRGWRLPSIAELGTLALDGNTNALPPGHPFTLPAAPSFWSETIYAAGTNVLVGHFGGTSLFITQQPQGDSYKAWCVRAPTGSNK